jgi:hypothetical protein
VVRGTARALAAALLALATACSAPPPKPEGAEEAPVPTAQRQALAHVERMRTIGAASNPAEARKYNLWLEEAWKFFLANPKDAVPVLRRELAAEMARKPRNDFMLLDLGYFLHEHGEAEDRAPAREALLALDPAAPVMRFNEQELFEFTHAAASDGDARVLDFIDRAYLRTTRSVQLVVTPAQASVAPAQASVTPAQAGAQSLNLDATGACIVLYGSYGDAAEPHLRRLLNDRAARRRVIETLIWIGSPEGNADVRSAMLAARDYETFVRGATFLIRAGGPQGRFLLLNIDPRALDVRTREYYNRIRKSVQETGFAQLAKAFDTDAKVRVPDAELKRVLAAMNSGYGTHDRVPPEAIVHSTLPREFLIEQLKRAREASLRRLTSSSLADVRVTDGLLNALYYREK